MQTVRLEKDAQEPSSLDDIEVSDLGAIPPGPLKSLSAGFNALGGTVIFLLMLLINGDVLGRFLFNHPISGVPEIVELSIIVIVFLQVANSVGTGRFIRSDSFHKMILARASRIGNILAIIYELAGAGLLATLCVGTIPVFLDAWENDRYIGNPGVFSAPVWPVQLIIVVGSGLTALVFFYAACSRFAKGKKAKN